MVRVSAEGSEMVAIVGSWAPSTVERLTKALLERRALAAHAATAFHVEAEEAMATVDLSDMLDNHTPGCSSEDSLLLAYSADEMMREIDDALERVANGTYGYCDRCRDRIALRRLKALPATRFCVDCQSALR